MDLFNTREIAVGIWLLALLAFLLPKTQIRSSATQLIKTFLQKKIVAVILLIMAYVFAVLYMLHSLELWDFSQTKNTIYWTVFVALISSFRVPAIAEDEEYFKKALMDNFRVIAAFEFVVTFYTFPLWIELIIIPLSTLLMMMQAISESKPEHKAAFSFTSNALGVLGGVLILYAGYKVITDFQSFATSGTVSDFLLPIVLSILFLPFLYVLNLVISYENVFVRIEISINDRSLIRYTKLSLLARLNFRTTLLKRWLRNFHIRKPTTRNEVSASISQVIKLAKRERMPPSVEAFEGWSPYLAREFLIAHGLKPGDYHSDALADGQWWASSPYLEIGEGILPNNIAYYVEGDEHVARTLRLSANFNVKESEIQAMEKLVECAAELFKSALQQPIPDAFLHNLVNMAPMSVIVNDKIVETTYESWPSGKGSSLRFSIRKP